MALATRKPAPARAPLNIAKRTRRFIAVGIWTRATAGTVTLWTQSHNARVPSEVRAADAVKTSAHVYETRDMKPAVVAQQAFEV